MAKKDETKTTGKGRETAPGQQQEITVQNVNGGDPWVGTKAAYAADKENLKAQGFVREDEAEESAEEPAPVDPAAGGTSGAQG